MLVYISVVQTCPNLSKLVQTCSNLFKLDQTYSNMSKLSYLKPSLVLSKFSKSSFYCYSTKINKKHRLCIYEDRNIFFLSFSLQYSRSAWPGNTYWQLLVYISAVTTEFCPYLAPARLNSAMMYYTVVWNRSKIAVLLLVKMV